MNRKQVLKESLVLVVCSLLTFAFFVPGSISVEQQPPDNWVARPMYISPFAGSSTPQGYNLTQIRTAYNLPSSGGAGATIAIIDAYDTPNILNDYSTFCNQFGLPNNSTGNFIVHKMPGNIGTDSGWAMETCLDVEWAHAIAPDAKILLVEAVSPNINALLAAIDYATSQPGVVAVSLSWGGEEFQWEDHYDSHFNKQNITFFASSGDDGTEVIWPAVSANVVSVGGTTLNLNPDGTVVSEIAWGNSSGGVSNYISRPDFQTNFGLDYPNRAVPDVSYNGNASTGVAVCYNNSWYKVGGTSAGAPQWAAIHALGLSATNNNLYERAKSTYSSYFRDITSGLNFVNSATTGYDLVTGLGSPLTSIFEPEVTVSPTSGPPAGAITISGIGCTPGGSVNISYLNPISNAWIPIIDNLTTASSDFTYNMNAPDLLQNSIAGDHQAIQDLIIFRVQDNSNNRSYNSTIPYAEGRRGLTQIDNTTATGLFGNNSNLASTVFVQNGQSIAVSGSWFSPGTSSLLWDDTMILGTVAIDGDGLFNANIQLPPTTAGRHRLIINNGGNNFCVNLTRLPELANDYVDEWHTSDFPINLTPDYSVNETYYRINGGPIFNVTVNGEPTITSEGSGNTLEYWSTWDVYGEGINEIPHVTLTGIKLDKTEPAGSVTTNTITDTPTIMLSLSTVDSTSGITQMRFSNDNTVWSNWEPYATSKTWILQGGDGHKTVSVQYIDNAGLTSTYSVNVTLETTQPASMSTFISATPSSATRRNAFTYSKSFTRPN